MSWLIAIGIVFFMILAFVGIGVLICQLKLESVCINLILTILIFTLLVFSVIYVHQLLF